MLTPYLNSQFVEKVLIDKHGRQFRCLFLVALVNDEIKAKLVFAQSLKPTNYKLKTKNYKVYLPITLTSKRVFIDHVRQSISSFFVPKDFSFVMSQMTRAPSN